MRKANIENIVLISLFGFLMVALGCSSRPVATRPLGPVEAARAEVKDMLMDIYWMELAYRQEHGSFWGDGVIGSAYYPTAFAPIGVEFGPDTRYSYAIIFPAAGSFLSWGIYGSLDDDPAQDMWTIDQAGSLVCLSDDTRM